MKTKEEIRNLLGNFYIELSAAKLSKEVIFVYDNYTDIFYNLQMPEQKPTQSESEINDILGHQRPLDAKPPFLDDLLNHNSDFKQPNIDTIKYLNADDLRQMTEIKPNIVYDKSELLPQPYCPQFTLSTDLAKQLIREKYNLPEDTIIDIQNPK